MILHYYEDNFQEMALESAITLLEKQVELQPTCKLHQMLGDLLARVHEEEKALDHYSIALK
jgi:anaphase-promoting complex subunit 7